MIQKENTGNASGFFVESTWREGCATRWPIDTEDQPSMPRLLQLLCLAMATPSSLLAQEPTKEDPYKDLNAFCICNHGMSLDIKPRDAQGKPLIHIDWSLTYNGPRTPV